MEEELNQLLSNSNSVKDDEFDNFMLKVEEVKKLVEGLNSNEITVAKETLKVVDHYLGNPEAISQINDEGSLRVKTCRTVINQKAFDTMGKDTQQEATTSEAFMKSCEEDAKKRTEERRRQKEASDTFKNRATIAFSEGNFVKALTNYNKAIQEFRESEHLYRCRALTYLKLKLYKKAIEDCDLVLRCFDEKSLKALLYKAKAHQGLLEDEIADNCVKDAIKNHPKCEKEILEYMRSEDFE